MLSVSDQIQCYAYTRWICDIHCIVLIQFVGSNYPKEGGV